MDDWFDEFSHIIRKDALDKFLSEKMFIVFGSLELRKKSMMFHWQLQTMQIGEVCWFTLVIPLKVNIISQIHNVEF